MKRMESKIALTYVIMFVLAVIINGIYSVVSSHSGFFTLEVIANGLFTALVYLAYIWINTRRHRVLTFIGVVSIGLLSFIFVVLFSEEFLGKFSDWNWKSGIMVIYYIIASQISSYQSKKLLEEDKETNTNINLHDNNDNITVEAVEIFHD